MVVWLAAKSVFLLEYEEEEEEEEEEKKVMEKAMRQGMRISPSNSKSVLTSGPEFLAAPDGSFGQITNKDSEHDMRGTALPYPYHGHISTSSSQLANPLPRP